MKTIKGCAYENSFLNILQELEGALTDLFGICDEIKAGCQLQEGSLLGAVKFSSLLPWERDADVAILSADFHQVIDAIQQRKQPSLGKLKICKQQNILQCFFFHCANHSGMFCKVLFRCENIGRQDDLANFSHFLT